MFKKFKALLLVCALMVSTISFMAYGAGAVPPVDGSGYLIMVLGEKNMILNGETVEVDPGLETVPVSIEGRTMIPARALTEAIGGKVDWDEGSRKVTLTVGENTLVMTIDQKDYLLNGETKQMDTAPIVLTGRTLIPLRFAGEALGCQVDWFAETDEILVTFALDAPEENKPGTSLGGSEVSIVDVMGHTVTLAAPASKVVGTHNPTLNQLVILGGGGKYIAGFGNKNMAGSLYALVYPELEEEVVQIGSGQNINFETVLAVEADLAIVPERFAGLVERFEEINVPAAVVLPSNESFDTIRESLLRVATLIGEDERAAEIIAFFDSTVSAVAAVVAEHEDHPTMIFTGSSSQLSVANGTLLQSEIMEAVGGINVAKEASGSGGFSNVSIEEIIGWDPEIIYIPVYASFTVEDILSDPAWASISAVQNERVYVFPSALEPWDYPTPSVALGLVWLLNNLYPEAYTLDQVLADAAAYYDLVYGQTFTAEQLGLK